MPDSLDLHKGDKNPAIAGGVAKRPRRCFRFLNVFFRLSLQALLLCGQFAFALFGFN